MGICMTVYHVCAWYLWRPEEGTGYPETEITDGCELPHGGWEPNPVPLQDQRMLLATESSFLHPRNAF